MAINTTHHSNGIRKEMVLRMRSHLLSGKIVVIVSFDPYSHHPGFIHDLLNDLAVFTNHLACDGTNIVRGKRQRKKKKTQRKFKIIVEKIKIKTSDIPTRFLGI